MPELPEVETIRRQLEPELIGLSIIGLSVFWSKTLEGNTQETIGPLLENQQIKGVLRRGKYFILHLGNGFLVYR